MNEARRRAPRAGAARLMSAARRRAPRAGARDSPPASSACCRSTRAPPACPAGNTTHGCFDAVKMWMSGGRRSGVVERADAHELERVAGAGVVAPQRDVAVRAAGDLLAAAAVRRRVDDNRVAAAAPRRDRTRSARSARTRSRFRAGTSGNGSNGRTAARRHPVAHAAAGASAFQRISVLPMASLLGIGQLQSRIILQRSVSLACRRRSLQLDGVAFRIGDVDRRAFAFGAVARTPFPRRRFPPLSSCRRIAGSSNGSTRRQK